MILIAVFSNFVVCVIILCCTGLSYLIGQSLNCISWDLSLRIWKCFYSVLSMLNIFRLVLILLFLRHSSIRKLMLILINGRYLSARSMLIVNCAYSLWLIVRWSYTLLSHWLCIIDMARQIHFRLDLIWIILDCAGFLYTNDFLRLYLSESMVLNLSCLLIARGYFIHLHLWRLIVWTYALFGLFLTWYLGRSIFLILNCSMRTTTNYHRTGRISGVFLLKAEMALLIDYMIRGNSLHLLISRVDVVQAVWRSGWSCEVRCSLLSELTTFLMLILYGLHLLLTR